MQSPVGLIKNNLEWVQRSAYVTFANLIVGLVTYYFQYCNYISFDLNYRHGSEWPLCVDCSFI